MVSQEKLVDFDNEIVLQPANVVALFFQRAKDATAHEDTAADEDATADEDTTDEDTAKQTFGSEDTAADEDATAHEDTAADEETFESEDATADEDTAKETFESEDARADEGATNTATKETFESEDEAAAADTAADEDAAKQTCRRANKATKQTFEDMGLRCEKNVATHLLLENAYESNLLSDISKVDYLAGNLGRTNLRPLEGLPAFVDDIFVYGYLSREECVFRKGKLSCTSGEQGWQNWWWQVSPTLWKEPWENENTCRRPLCTRSRLEIREVAQYAQQLRKSSKTHSTMQKENGERSIRKKRLPGILWRNAMYPKSLWRSCTVDYTFSKNAWRDMDTESTASTTHKIFPEYWTAKRLWAN